MQPQIVVERVLLGVIRKRDVARRVVDIEEVLVGEALEAVAKRIRAGQLILEVAEPDREARLDGEDEIALLVLRLNENVAVVLRLRPPVQHVTEALIRERSRGLQAL